MIVLNSTKELIRVENWADIEARPGFSRELDPKNHELAGIIGRYAFAERIRCGLTNCHTPHIRGYIVSTKDGHETNIGKDCGKNYFGVDFETLTRQFDQDITDKENRERLWSLRFQSEEVKLQIRNLRTQPQGADWVFHTSRPLVEAGRAVPNEIVRRIVAMVRTRQNVVAIEREATEAEIEQMEAQRGRKLPRPQYVEDAVGQIEGMEALFPENDLRQLLVVSLEQEMNAFENVDIDSASSATLSHWNKWSGGVGSSLDRARTSIDFGRILLRTENLAPLVEFATDPEHKDRMRKYLKTLQPQQ